MSTSIPSEPIVTELKNGSKSTQKTDEEILQMPLKEYLQWCADQGGSVYSDEISEELSKMTLAEYHDWWISSPIDYGEISDYVDAECEEYGERMHLQSGASETEVVDNFPKRKPTENEVDVPKSSKFLLTPKKLKVGKEIF